MNCAKHEYQTQYNYSKYLVIPIVLLSKVSCNRSSRNVLCEVIFRLEHLKMSYCNGPSLVLLVCVALATSHVCYGQYSHSIYIDPRPTVGKDTPQCITSNSPSIPCKTLNWTFLPEHRSSSTQYVLLDNRPHQLHDTVETFANITTMAFIGSEVNTTIHCTGAKTGLAFINITDLVFVNITFIGCASERMSTSRNFSATDHSTFSTVQVSLYFYHCHDVSMTNLRVENPGSGATGVIMYDSDGVNTIANSYFVKCTVEPDHPGGGGFYVEFSYCVPGDTSCFNDSDDIISYESRNRGAQYHFIDCVFSHNIANNADNLDVLSTYIIPYRSAHEAFGRGGGLSFYIKGNATQNILNVSGCVFDSNQALWGGGLFIEFHDDAINNTLIVSQTRFENNSCHLSSDSGTDGGGMRLAHYVYHPHVVEDLAGNKITVVDCDFTNNTALNGGGLSVFPARQQSKIDHVASIDIIRTNFDSNVAKLGAGIHASPFAIFTQGNMLKIRIRECNFVNNNVDYIKFIDSENRQPYQVGVGAVYSNEVELIFEENVNFTGNSGSALAVVGTSVNFSNCDACFVRNKGNNGGAVALLGAAYIQIGDNTSMYFQENVAMSEGGAIYNKYIERENLKSYTNCFIRHEDPFRDPEDWKANFIFDTNSNHGGDGIRAIHSTSLYPCSRAGGDGISNRTLFCQPQQFSYTYFPPFKPHFYCEDFLSSDVGKIKYSSNGPVVRAFPGASFSLPVIIHDELSKDVSNETVFEVSANYTRNSTIGYDIARFEYFWGETATIKGGQNQSVALKLDSIGDRVWHVEVIVQLQPCPPGLHIDQENGENSCKCPQNYDGALLCEIGLFRSLLKNYHWMGKIKGHDEYVVGRCPPGYCNISHNTSHIVLPQTNEMLQEMICNEINRTDTLCGKCMDDYGPAVNSLTYDCIYCNSSNVSISTNIAKYVASVYVPLFFMFTILILFDIRLTTGPANAFILYCQVVASTFDLNADGQIPLNNITNSADKLLKAYRVPYGIFNLEFFEGVIAPLCLGTSFNNLTVFVLDYAVALCPLLMILFVIVCVKIKECMAPRCCKTGNQWGSITSMSLTNSYKLVGQQIATRNRRISKAILPAFAAFVLLSYTKFSTVSSFLIRYQSLFTDNGTTVKNVVYYAGHFDASDKHYLYHYYTPAVIIFATFVLIPPLLLLDYPLRGFERVLGKVDCLWRFYPVDKIHVFLDTFQGCYKNKMRFFAGLYFLFRLVINVSYVLTYTWLEQFVVQQLACTIIIILLALFQPYNEENKLFNFVDIMIFANLAALNALSFYMYSYSLYNPLVHPPTTTFAFQYLLVFLPLIYMLGYITWSVTKPHHQKLMNRTKNALLLVCVAVRGKKSTQLQSVAAGSTVGIATPISPYVREEEASTAEIEAMLSRAEIENTYRPSKKSHEPDVEKETIKQTRSSENSSLRSSMSTSMHYGSTNSSSKDSEAS